MNTEEIKAERLRKKRRALFRFRAVVRLVILNRHWLMELEDQKLGTNVKRNIALITRRKRKRGLLSITEKSLLKKPLEERTPAERRRLVTAISSLPCFSRYPPRVRSRLARVSFYMFFEVGRVILKEGHRAGAMYFILEGEIEVTQRQFDPHTNQYIEKSIGIREPGDSFGEIALLDEIQRTATCTCTANVELLCIFANDFNQILRETLQTQWDQIILAVQRFDYFNTWTKAQLRECCIISKIKEYQPLQMVYNEDKGLLNFVYFVLSGQCTILQCLKMRSKTVDKQKKYQLSSLLLKKSASSEVMDKMQQAADVVYETAKQHSVDSQLGKKIDVEEESHRLTQQLRIIPKMLLEHSRQSGESTTNPSELFRSNSAEDPENVEYYFIEIGSLTCGAVFGLGERMQHRMIIAKTPVQCLLIPRYWLLQNAQNIANIWRRTQMFLEATIPSREALFEEFVANRKWKKYKKDLIKSLVVEKELHNITKVEDIPIICRIVEGEE